MTDGAFVFPTSFAQERLWFLDQLVPNNAFYNLDTCLRLYLAVDHSVLERSLNEVIRRHETLRTTFQVIDTTPVQVVAASLRIDLPLIDLSTMTVAERELRVLQIATEECQRPFNLALGPLIRASLVRLHTEEHVFLLTMHHIIADGWSMGVLFEELSEIYTAFSQGQPSLLPELHVQYADFAVWQKKWLSGAVVEDQLTYWKHQLRDLPRLQLPTDWTRPAVQSFAGGVRTFWLPANLYFPLVELSQQESVTLFMTMLAAFQTLLSRYSAQDDIAVGTPVANRSRAELEGLIGFFVNTLVVRTDLSANPGFRELLSRVRETLLEAYANQDLPFEKLVHELQPDRDMGRNPLFQVHFQLFSDMVGAGEPGLLDGEPLEIEKGTANFDLALDLWEYPDGMWGTLEYSTDLFTQGTIDRMVEHFQILLRGIVADPDQRLSDLPILAEREREQLLITWNNTGTHYPRNTCLHQLFEERAELTPDSVALDFRGQQLTYAELNQKSNQLARYLTSLGVRPEMLVGICIERSLEMVIGLLGILKAGGAYVPLNPAYPSERTAFMLHDTQTPLLLTQARLVKKIPAGPTQRVCLDADWEIISRFSEALPESEVESHNLAYVMYTSGSTGKPKGVMVSHRSVSNHLLWMQTAFPLTEKDRSPQKYPFNFDASVCEIFCPLIAGAQLIITEPADHWDIEAFIKLVSRQQITVLDLVPSMLQALLDDDQFRECRSLRRVICGGESLSPELRDRLLTQFHIELGNIYGPTEATIGSTSWTCDRSSSQPRVPIGRPIANTQAYILDAHRNPVPIGVTGELYIGGDGLARGYLNQPHLTSEKFVPHPFAGEKSARLYRTGDLARHLPDGNIECLGRVDQQVKIRGYRIELGEVENVLAQHEAVDSCVAAIRDDTFDRARLVAYVVPADEKPELWPSLGEYATYDELLYYAMTHDEVRNRSYQNAIARDAKNKTALDIGCGADAILARFCIQTGADRVYAIEANDEAHRQASELVGRLGLSERIILIHGDSSQVQLPEKVDVCVSEILGTIGSSEGVASILNDARRFLKDDGVMIPQRCVTRIAAITLPDEIATWPHLNELPQYYIQKVFKTAGHPFDLRLCIKNFPLTNLLSEAQVFEDLNFAGCVEPEYDSQVTFTVKRHGRLDGFLLWLNLYLSDDDVIDSLRDRLNWLPVFFPVFHPGLEVFKGDVIETVCSSRLSKNSRNPDYTISGTLKRNRGKLITFTHSSPHLASTFKANAFYDSLLAGVNGGAEISDSPVPISQRRNGNSVRPKIPPPVVATKGLVPTLRAFLPQHLPDYMIPSAIVILNEIPLTPNGKVDIAALPPPSQSQSEVEASYIGPRNEAEKQLATIWCELLGLKMVSIHENFFDLGGDSILSIQIIARANQAGFRLRPAQLFQHQTIAELAAVADATPAIQAEQGVLTGTISLTPIQSWFFEQDLAEPHHYNQAVLLEAPPSIDVSRLVAVLNYLASHHDSLRLRFVQTSEGLQLTYGETGPVPVSVFDLSPLELWQRTNAIEQHAAQIQAGLNLSEGPLIRAAVFDFGPAEVSQVLIAIHHLGIDGVSWRILLEDLWTAYDQLTGGQQIHLPPKTTSFQYWAKRLNEYAKSPAASQEIDYWLSVASVSVPALPRDLADGPNTVASVRRVVFSLSLEETRLLLQKVPKAYHTQINDVLLTALLQSFAQWTEQTSLLIDLEGHGRENLFEDVDLSRTVGWFTTIFPVYLDLEGITDEGEVLKSVKEQLRRIPNRGIGYGVLRYLTNHNQRLQLLARPEVSFNYQGQFDHNPSESSTMAVADPTTSNLSLLGQRRYLLEIDSGVYEGRLQVDWSYSECLHRRATIERLVEYFAAALRSLITHCSSNETGGYTPSDFSAARVSQDDLEKLLALIGANQPEVDQTDEV